MPARPQVNLRLDPRSERLMKLLQRRLNLGASGVLRAALAALAREQGVRLPDEDDEADDGE
jgi:hypothetical protein